MQGLAGSYSVQLSDDTHLQIDPTTGSQETSFTITALYVENDNLFDFETYLPADQTFQVRYKGIFFNA